MRGLAALLRAVRGRRVHTLRLVPLPPAVTVLSRQARPYDWARDED